MSALADALRALITPAASAHECYEPARDVLRKYAPCGCGFKLPALNCRECNGAGWTPASVEVAIARAEELEARTRELVGLANIRNDEKLNEAAYAVRDLLP